MALLPSRSVNVDNINLIQCLDDGRAKLYFLEGSSTTPQFMVPVENYAWFVNMLTELTHSDIQAANQEANQEGAVMYDRDIFFGEVRDALFSGAMSQEQVDGKSVILAVWEYQAGGTPMEDQRWLAYMLATTFHETAEKMWPIENGDGAGKSYGQPDPDTGETYYGRGYVQLTWRENYAKASRSRPLRYPRP